MYWNPLGQSLTAMRARFRAVICFSLWRSDVIYMDWYKMIGDIVDSSVKVFLPMNVCRLTDQCSVSFIGGNVGHTPPSRQGEKRQQLAVQVWLVYMYGQGSDYCSCIRLLYKVLLVKSRTWGELLNSTVDVVNTVAVEYSGSMIFTNSYYLLKFCRANVIANCIFVTRTLAM